MLNSIHNYFIAITQSLSSESFSPRKDISWSFLAVKMRRSRLSHRRCISFGVILIFLSSVPFFSWLIHRARGTLQSESRRGPPHAQREVLHYTRASIAHSVTRAVAFVRQFFPENLLAPGLFCLVELIVYSRA